SVSFFQNCLWRQMLCGCIASACQIAFASSSYHRSNSTQLSPLLCSRLKAASHSIHRLVSATIANSFPVFVFGCVHISVNHHLFLAIVCLSLFHFTSICDFSFCHKRNHFYM